MALPPDVDAVVRQRFDDLIAEAGQIISNMNRDNETGHAQISSEIIFWGEIHYQTTAYYAFITKVTSLIQLVLAESKRSTRLIDDIRELNSGSASTEIVLGILHGLKTDYENGMLRNLQDMIEANVTADYLEQAEQLLGANKTGQYGHVPAAVLTGAVLEDGLRRLCERQEPQIPVTKSDGKHKMLNDLITDLKKANMFNELKAKQLRYWADIRNAAAHGQFDEFARSDVEQMLKGVQAFLADYM